MLVSILSGFRAPFHTLRLLVGGREDGRGHGAFGGPGKRGGNKKEPLDLVRWIVRDAGEREGWLGFKAPSPPRLLVGGREDGRGYGYGTLVAPKRGAATTRNRWIWCGGLI